ncbi:hypothetical protein [Hafnia paralvei]|uniref:hypothetical protein n=1 Tax=Hafnia paralvei TaxID=546367 RepID=UPI001034E36C|nr:hypothetical protein [Hafnia paralvei]TBL56443.1 hypothetical protein EYY97_21715 [Hafnia paralvei]
MDKRSLTASEIQSFSDELSNLIGLASLIHEQADKKLDSDYMELVCSLGILRKSMLNLSYKIYAAYEEVSKHE